MKKAKNKSNISKYMIVGIALALATLGYFGYKNLLTKPDINKIDDGGNSRGDKGSKNNNQLNNKKSNQENTVPSNPKSQHIQEKIEKIPSTQYRNITPKNPNPGK